MSKGGFMTPKAIGNRIKAKGLQKLRWYCQMCEKQCRDENGFKCHCLSEAHTRQMQLFAENPGKFMDSYSNDFEREFLEILRRKGEKRVKANNVYQELVSNRVHIHMNSTKWTSLTSFLQYLGREGKAVVDQTEKGWFIRWVNRDPEAIARRAAIEKREAGMLDAEERATKMLAQTVAKANAEAAGGGAADATTANGATELKRDENGPKIAFSLSFGAKKETAPPAAAAAAAAAPTAAATEPATTVPTATTAAATGGPATAATATATPTTTTAAAAVPVPIAAIASSSAPAPVASATPVFALKALKPKLANVFAAAPAPTKRDGDGDGDGDDEEDSSAPNQKKQKTESGSHGSHSSSGGSSSASGSSNADGASNKRKAGSALESVMLQNEAYKQTQKRTEDWIVAGIIVKVVNKKLANGKFYGKKGTVRSVRDKFVGEIEIIGDEPGISGTKLSIDQSELQTVIPALGHAVRIVNGAYRGSTATLQSINTDQACATVKITSGLFNGRTVDKLEYEDFSKLA